MWIRREEYDELRERIGELTVKLGLANNEVHNLTNQLAVTRNNEDWLRTQCNVANFRADALFTQMTNARLPTPAIERAEKEMDEQIEMTKGGALPGLEDPGDEIAQRLGISHGADGSLIFR